MKLESNKLFQKYKKLMLCVTLSLRIFTKLKAKLSLFAPVPLPTPARFNSSPK